MTVVVVLVPVLLGDETGAGSLAGEGDRDFWGVEGFLTGCCCSFSHILVPSRFKIGDISKDERILLTPGDDEPDSGGLSMDSGWWKRERAFFTTDGLSSIGLPVCLGPEDGMKSFSFSLLGAGSAVTVSSVTLAGSAGGGGGVGSLGGDLVTRSFSGLDGISTGSS